MTTFSAPQRSQSTSPTPAAPPADSRDRVSQFMQGIQEEISQGLQA